jgi:hypothetical protein
MRYQTAPCPVTDAARFRATPAAGARIIPERPALQSI